MARDNGIIESKREKSPNECLSKIQVSEAYILHSAINEHPSPKLAISLSTNNIVLYDVESQAKVIDFKKHEDSVTGIQFSQETPDLLFSSSLDGQILLWDLRKGILPVKTFCDNTDSSPKPITCFDYNLSERYICGGTEIIREDSFLIFWDVRITKPVGGYWDTHSDDITQVQFSFLQESNLVSSSVDGIINLFDLNEQTEEDALQHTLNIGSSVNRFCWGNMDTISCITSTEEYQFWTSSAVEPLVSMNKKQLTEDFMCDVDYLINTFEVKTCTYLATGANDGSIQLYSCNSKGLKIIRELRNAHTDIVRTVCHSKENRFFVTGGEDGILCTWKSPLL